MLKRMLSAPPRDETIADYTSHLYYFLRPGLTDERANQIVSEAHAHLLDRAEAIAQAENLPHDEAEAQAVAAFTPAVTFARRMVESAYETGQSRLWRKAGGVVAVVTFCELLRRVMMNDFVLQSTSYLIVAAVLLAAWCAFQARRAQTQNLIIGGVTASLTAFVFCQICFWNGAPYWTATSRGSVEWASRRYQQEVARQTADITLLNTGVQTFREPYTDNEAVPSELRGPGGKGYLVPAVHPARGGVRPFQKGRPETVATLDAARTRWLIDGYFWLADVGRLRFLYIRDKNEQLAFNQKISFGWTQIFGWTNLGYCAALFVLCDTAFAALGRRVYRRKQGVKYA